MRDETALPPPASPRPDRCCLLRHRKFLHKEYETGFFWWEPVETMRKLFLTGILLWLVPDGEEFKRMIFATLVSIIFMLLVALGRPFKYRSPP